MSNIRTMLVEHYPKMFGLALKLTNGQEDRAEDIVQEAILIALTKAPRDLENPRGWIANVIKNVAHNIRRTDNRFTDGGIELADMIPVSPPPTIELAEAASVLAAMPARRRDAFLLVVVHGYSVNDAAEILRVHNRAILPHVAKARDNIREGRASPGWSRRLAA